MGNGRISQDWENSLQLSTFKFFLALRSWCLVQGRGVLSSQKFLLRSVGKLVPKTSFHSGQISGQNGQLSELIVLLWLVDVDIRVAKNKLSACGLITPDNFFMWSCSEQENGANGATYSSQWCSGLSASSGCSAKTRVIRYYAHENAI